MGMALSRGVMVGANFVIALRIALVEQIAFALDRTWHLHRRGCGHCRAYLDTGSWPIYHQ